MSDEDDFQVEVYRAGDHASVRVIHLPTGLVATREDLFPITLAKAQCKIELRQKLVGHQPDAPPPPVHPLEWHEGPSAQDAAGVWWDLHIGHPGMGEPMSFVHREMGTRWVIAANSIESKVAALEERLARIERLLRE